MILSWWQHTTQHHPQREQDARSIRESWDILDQSVTSISGKKQNTTIASTSTNKSVQIHTLSNTINVMLIAWIQQTSLVDYPDKIACIIFTAGCNLRCRFCHNPALVLPWLIAATEPIPNDVFLNFLEQRKWLIDAVVISWWEPTLQSDLIDFCRTIKEKWFLVKLDTNGRDPAIVRSLLEQKLIDYIAMDSKIDHAQRLTLLQNKEHIHPYQQTMDILIHDNYGCDYEFRTTLMKPYHTRENFVAMLRLIQWAKNYYLQTYRPEKTLDPDFDGVALTHDEMKEFQTLAQDYVQKCMIRY